MDFFLVFYAIIGGAICLALTLLSVLIYLTSREEFPPAVRRSAELLPAHTPDIPVNEASELAQKAA